MRHGYVIELKYLPRAEDESQIPALGEQAER